LALLALGYLGKYVYDSQKGKLPLIQVPSYEASRYHPSVPLQPVQANYSDDRQHAIPRSSQGMSASSYSAPPSYHQANS
jgi:hypothetical protein